MATTRSSTAGDPRPRRARSCRAALLSFALALVLALAVPPAPLRAQATAADSAAILLDAAEALAREGRGDAAAALLAYIRTHYGATAAGVEAARRLAALPPPGQGAQGAPQSVPQPATGGRTELTVWGTTYGIWLGVAAPLALGAEGPGAVGSGLLLGGPVGFLAARGYARATDITEGEARAITFGGTWGTWQGYGFGKLLGLLDRKVCPQPLPGQPALSCYSETSGRAGVKAALLGGLTGITAGAVLGGNVHVTPGTATAVNLAALWGTAYGLGTGALVGADGGDAPLAFALLGGDAALVGAALAAPRWRLSRERVRLISIAGLAGALAGTGLDLILKVSDKTAVAIPMAGGAIGMAAGAGATRGMPQEAAAGGANGRGAPGGANAGGAPGGALLRVDGGRFAVGLPGPTPLFRRAGAARVARTAPALFLPLFQARF